MFRLGNAQYHGAWKHRQDVFNAYFPADPDEPYTEFQMEDMKAFPEDSHILFAAHHQDRDGFENAKLLFLRDGQLYFSSGDSHPETWRLYYDPCQVSWLELWSHHEPLTYHSIKTQEAWRALVGHNVTSLVEVVDEMDDGTLLTITRKVSGSTKRFMLVPEEFINAKAQEEG